MHLDCFCVRVRACVCACACASACVYPCVLAVVNRTCPPCSSWWRHSCWNASSPAQPAAPTQDSYPKRGDMTCETTREAAPNCRGRDRMQDNRKEHTTLHRKETMRKTAHARSAARLSVQAWSDWALGGTLSLPGTAIGCGKLTLFLAWRPGMAEGAKAEADARAKSTKTLDRYIFPAETSPHHHGRQLGREPAACLP